MSTTDASDEDVETLIYFMKSNDLLNCILTCPHCGKLFEVPYKNEKPDTELIELHEDHCKKEK